MFKNHYWSCTKFADWVRGTPKGEAKTSEGWDEWTEHAKSRSPIRFWISEEGLDKISRVVYFIPDKLYDLKYYINNRWITKSHSLTAHSRDIKPGSWCDVGNRFLPCLFNELVEFVEVELAWWHLAWNSEDRSKYKAPWWAFGWFRIRSWRCPQAGLDNLEWQRKLVFDDEWSIDSNNTKFGKPTPQAEKAQEILDLYTWWTVTRPARPDPYEVSGWTAYSEAMREKYGAGISSWNKKDKKEKAQSTKAQKMLDKLEAAYEKEDEDYMIRLIKVRNGLWT